MQSGLGIFIGRLFGLAFRGSVQPTFVLTHATAPVVGPPQTTLVEDLDVGQAHSIATLAVAMASGQVLTKTVRLRANGRFRGIFFVSTNAGGANRFGMNFNLNTQVITNFTLGAGVVNSIAIQAMGGGEYLLTISGAQNGGDVTTSTVVRLADATGNATYDGDGVSGMFIK